MTSSIEVCSIGSEKRMFSTEKEGSRKLFMDCLMSSNDCFTLQNSSSVSKNLSSSVCSSMTLRSFLRLNMPFDCLELFNRLMRRVVVLFSDSLDVEKLISSLNGTPKISSKIKATGPWL